MILKSLELYGFKSFPDRTIIDFGAGITAIVGPNGSGKSNISDAIRWVLGETSTKTLRGTRMEDVIFAGTARRKGASYAEVSLVIDNTTGFLKTEYDEVRVTRRFYRSGDSDYYINKKPARLKDIHELFMDTGLGRDGYSMIGQGRVDEVLSQKSVERRDMFEEAAGISKYKYRKEETERKLDAAEENLVRVGDLLAGVEERKNPLEKKAEKARRYLALRDELRGDEIALWMDDLRLAGEKSRKARGDLKLASFSLEEARRENEKNDVEADELSAAREKNTLEAEEMRELCSGIEKDTAALQGEIRSRETSGVLRRKNIDSLTEESRNQKERIAGMEKDGLALKSKTAENRARSLSIAGELTSLREKIAAYEKTAGERDAACEKLRAALRENEKNETAATAAGESLLREKLSLEERLAGLEKSRKEQADTLATGRKNLEESEEGLQLRETLTQQKNARAGLVLKQASSKAALEELTEALRKEKAELERIRSRKNLLSDMQRDYEGFGQAVRYLMREKRRGTVRGLCGTVAELMHTEKRTALALEMALGGALQNIVTEDETAAKTAIGLLKRANQGRSTFLPLNAIRPSFLNEKGLENEEGFVGIASSLVTTEERYRDIISNLLGRTVVCENLDAAVALAKRRGYRFKIVTLDGQLVNPGGSLTGGSTGRAGGILSRAGELEELAEAEKTSGERIALLEEKNQKRRSLLESLELDLREITEDINQTDRRLFEMSANNAAEEKLLENLARQQTSLEEEIGLLTGKIVALEAAIAGEYEKLRKAREEKKRLEDTLRPLEEEKSPEGENLRAQEASLLVEQAALEAGYAEMLERSKEQLLRMEEATEAKRNAEEQLLEEKENLAQSEREQTELKARLEEKQEEGKKNRASLDLLLKEGLQLEARRTENSNRTRELTDRLVRLEKETQRLELLAGTLTEEEDRITRSLWESYELTLQEAEKLAPEQPPEDRPALKNRVGELRRKMKAIGEVDVSSIEEYQEVLTRYNELVTQKTDIENSRDELHKLVTDISREMAGLFREHFALLNQYFNESFKEIFGGGSAELRLEDPKEVLTCGIEIVCRLPGKNLRSISLLSGGEKAFVAIALYFAILKLRPAPFCVLDEIEAALDDGNVTRFARYMRTLTEKTQFIAITHRRGTMEEADILYGVTMQEPGVTRLLMMELSEAEEVSN